MCLAAHIYPSIGFLVPLPYTGMYNYAKEHGFITDDDVYLDSITERQDICINMTQMADNEIMDCIKEGAERLNRELELGLNSDRLVRTGGYREHAKKTACQNRALIDPDNMKRNQNDVSFNYSQVVFEMDMGLNDKGSEDSANRVEDVNPPVINSDQRHCA